MKEFLKSYMESIFFFFKLYLKSVIFLAMLQVLPSLRYLKPDTNNFLFVITIKFIFLIEPSFFPNHKA